VDLVDIVILLAVVAAALHGLWLGAAVQALSFVGLAAGLLVGAALAPVLARLADDPFAKALLGLVSVFGLAAIFGTLGRQVGVRMWGRLRRTRLATFDAILGAVVASAATLLSAWLIGSLVANVPARPLSGEVQRSAVLRALDRILPPAPDVFSRVQRILDAHGLPQVFAQFEPAPAARLPLPADPVVRAAVEKAGASTVKIMGPGCGGILEGSGFVVAPDVVVTNAHVVAGVRRPVVLDRRGSHPAVAVLFDPNLDLAVLRATGVTDPPLSLEPRAVDRGTAGAVLGYPGGGPFDAEPAVVLARIDAVGRNIYGQGLTTRLVYELESRIRPGNSGGPLVRPDGSVAGVVFSRSVRNDDIGFALTSDEVAREVTPAEQRTTPVSTGPCAAE